MVKFSTNPHSELVKKFLGSRSVEDATELIEFFRSPDIQDEDVAELSIALAYSGKVLDMNLFGPIADIASTGGPSSLSTILCPLYLVQNGARVISLGVPGRPAGGVDVLAQISGYKIELTEQEIRGCLAKSSYVHVLVNRDYSPADGVLFTIRQQSGAQAVPSLVTASLLSKKLAVGVTEFGLDVRVSPYGNFGTTWYEARENARRLCRVGSLVGVNARCFLTDARFLFQPYVGRGESLMAISALIGGEADQWLDAHAVECSKIANIVAPGNGNLEKGIRDVFLDNLMVQGGDLSAFSARVENLKRMHEHDFVTAKHSGFLRIDFAQIRDTLVTMQRNLVRIDRPFPDPGGVIFKKNVGDRVTPGERLASLRFENGDVGWLKGEVESAISISNEPLNRTPMETVENA